MYYIFWYLQKAFDFLWFINKYLKKVSKKVSKACIPDASIIVKRGHVRAFASRTAVTTALRWTLCLENRLSSGAGVTSMGKEPFLSATQIKLFMFPFTVASRQKWLLFLSIPGFSHPQGWGAGALPHYQLPSQTPSSYNQIKESSIKSQHDWSLRLWTRVVGVTQKRDPNPNDKTHCKTLAGGNLSGICFHFPSPIPPPPSQR